MFPTGWLFSSFPGQEDGRVLLPASQHAIHFKHKQSPQAQCRLCFWLRGSTAGPIVPSRSLLLPSAFRRMLPWDTAGLSKGLGARC